MKTKGGKELCMYITRSSLEEGQYKNEQLIRDIWHPYFESQLL